MQMTDCDSKTVPPLKPAAFYILLVLGAGAMHGYAMMQEITTITEGKIRIGPGTLYRTINQLLTDGLIEETGIPLPPSDDDERRRYYQLTELGQYVVRAELMYWSNLIALPQAQQLLGGII